MKKKKIIMIVLIIITYTLVYKAWNLLIYTTSDGLNEYISDKINMYSNPKKITINKKESKKYIKYDKLQLEDIFDGYEKINIEEDKLLYVKFEGDDISKYLSISKTNDYKTIYINGFEKYSEQDDNGVYEDITLYDKEKTMEYLENNSIRNDINLFEFLTKNHSNKNKLLNKNNKMKENYYIKEYILNVIPKIKSYFIFEGLDGYMFKTSSDGYEIHIHDYVVKTTGMSEEEIIELVRTIKIDE